MAFIQLGDPFSESCCFILTDLFFLPYKQQKKTGLREHLEKLLPLHQRGMCPSPGCGSRHPSPPYAAVAAFWLCFPFPWAPLCWAPGALCCTGDSEQGSGCPRPPACIPSLAGGLWCGAACWELPEELQLWSLASAQFLWSMLMRGDT